MRFEVPQFIEVEAKIVGPLTWRQFVYVAGGAGLLVILYLSAPFSIFVMLGVPVGIFAGSLAFHRVNNRPFSSFLEAVFNYALRSKLYLWKRSEMQSVITHRETPLSTLEYTNKRTLSSLSHSLDIHDTKQD
jgi:hypothetical protein